MSAALFMIGRFSMEKGSEGCPPPGGRRCLLAARDLERSGSRVYRTPDVSGTGDVPENLLDFRSTRRASGSGEDRGGYGLERRQLETRQRIPDLALRPAKACADHGPASIGWLFRKMVCVHLSAGCARNPRRIEPRFGDKGAGQGGPSASAE
jgi:hypothetical protein